MIIPCKSVIILRVSQGHNITKPNNYTCILNNFVNNYFHMSWTSLLFFHGRLFNNYSKNKKKKEEKFHFSFVIVKYQGAMRIVSKIIFFLRCENIFTHRCGFKFFFFHENTSKQSKHYVERTVTIISSSYIELKITPFIFDKLPEMREEMLLLSLIISSNFGGNTAFVNLLNEGCNWLF